MKEMIFLWSLILGGFTFAQQNENEIDLMLDKMCEILSSPDNTNDSLTFIVLNRAFITPYLMQFTESEWKEKGDGVFYRFQKRCIYFKNYLKKVNPTDLEDWVSFHDEPVSSITNQELDVFKKSNFIGCNVLDEKSHTILRFGFAD